MQKHRRADTDGEAGNGSDERLFRPPECFDETMRLRFAALACCYTSEIADIVSGGESVAFRTEENDANGFLRLRVLLCFPGRAIHGVGECVLLVGACERDLQHTFFLFGFDMFGHVSISVEAAIRLSPSPPHARSDRAG